MDTLRLVNHNRHLQNSLRIRMTKYIPHMPTPKQRVFLLLPHREAFYGGAAGGGKSDALLMAALQYVDVPGYSAIIFRKTLTDADLPNAIMARSRQWLNKTDAEFKKNCWHFPSGAKLTFGFMPDETTKFRYQSAEFQFIGFDELTHFEENDYRYLFSRLRKTKCPIHKDVPNTDCRVCREFSHLGAVPLRIRSAANPGGRGHLWVRQRFDIGPWITGHDSENRPIYKLRNGKRIYIGRNPNRPFIPALIQDNPYLDYEEYAESLSELDPVTREQLLNGDWSVSADGRFRKSWVRYYSFNGPYVVLGRNRRGKSWKVSDCYKYQIVDPAASAREGPGDEQVYRSGSPSWTVITTFLLTPDGQLLVYDVRRFQKEIPDVIANIKKAWKVHRPQFVGIENSGLGIGVYQSCARLGLPVRPMRPLSQDKLVRATDACNRMEQGRFWFPEIAPWLDDLESEVFTWTGHPHDQDDQVDTLSYGSKEASRLGAGTPWEETVNSELDSVSRPGPVVFDDLSPL